MKKHFSILIALLLCLSASAEDYSKYYTDLPVQLQQVTAFTVPETRVSIADFGAVGDGKTLNTEAFANAIKALVAKGGGHLDVPAGVWKTGPFQLKSNIDLHVAKGATILFSEDKTLYLKKDKSGKVSGKCVPMISVSKSENIMITGEGTIDGQGDYWRAVKKSKVSADEWARYNEMGGTVMSNIWYPFNLKAELNIPNINKNAKSQESMRYHLINITDSKNVLIQGVRIQNSPKFHLVPARIENLIIDGITIWCHGYAQNGDAMDIGNSKRVLVVNSEINCGDDGICMKGGVGQDGFDRGPNTDFLIQNNIVHQAHGGFVIGSEFSGGMKKMVVRNCKFDGTDIGLRFKSAPGRGGTCEDIYCYNIQMTNMLKEAILFETTYEDVATGGSATAGDDKNAWFPDFCNFKIYDVTVDGATTAMKLNGLKDHPIHDITLENVTMKNCKNGLNLNYAENIMMTKTDIKSNNKNLINSVTCKNVKLNGKALVK